MERQSTKHGARLDDELKRETQSLERGAPIESRVQEGREKEPAADEEREPSGRTASPELLGPDEVSARRELSRFLGLRVFPARPSALVRTATENGAPDLVLELLGRLPEERRFENLYDVWEGLTGHRLAEGETGRA
jgi:hypothetical protein